MFVTILLCLMVLLTFYKLTTLNHNHWKYKGIPYKKPYPFFGNLLPVFLKKESYVGVITTIYREFDDHRFVGIFNLSKPTLILKDIKLVNSVLKSNFSHVSSRGLYFNHKKDPLSVNLFFMDGLLWKRSRELLRPGFKSARLRALVPSIEESARFIFGQKQDHPVEVKRLCKHFAAAIIIGPVLGLDLDEENLKEFVFHCEQSFNVQGWRAIPVLLRFFIPSIAFALGIKCVPQKTEDFFKNVVQKLKLKREDGLKRDDYFQTISTMINNLDIDHSNSNKEFLDALLSGQFFIFVLAGFETTTSALTHALYLLAQNQEVCSKAREEIIRVMSNNINSFTYDHLKELKYLENVINETLRLYPPIGGFIRICTSAYNLPNTNIILQPGDSVQIPVEGIHYDPKYFNNPKEFNPSRFDDPIVEGTFIPFSDGPRNCLGMRLAMMELKLVLAYILGNFNIFLDSKTPEFLQLDLDRLSNIPKSDIWMNFRPL